MKKSKIIIAIIIILIMFIIGGIIERNLKKKDNNIVEVVPNTDALRFEDKMTNFEELLAEEGIELTDKEAITSEELNENGYNYAYNGEQLEMYNISQLKMKNITHRQINEFEFIILTKDYKKIDAIYYNEILILNCKMNKEELLSVLEILV